MLANQPVESWLDRLTLRKLRPPPPAEHMTRRCTTKSRPKRHPAPQIFKVRVLQIFEMRTLEDIIRNTNLTPQPGLAHKALAHQQDAGGGCQPNSLSRKKFANSARIDAEGLEPRAIRGGDAVKLHKFDLRWRDERVRQPLRH